MPHGTRFANSASRLDDHGATGDCGDSSTDEGCVSLVCDLAHLNLTHTLKLDGDEPVRCSVLVHWLMKLDSIYCGEYACKLPVLMDTGRPFVEDGPCPPVSKFQAPGRLVLYIDKARTNDVAKEATDAGEHVLCEA